MKQWSPFAYPGAGGKHVNAVPSLNQRGSWPDGMGYQQIIDELVALVVAAGLVPTDADSQQVMKAVRGGSLVSFTDSSNAANAIVITPAIAHTAIFKNLPFRIWPANTNTQAAVSLTINGLTGLSIKKADGTNPAAGDIVAGVPLDVVCDGVNFRSVRLLKSDLVAIAQGTPAVGGQIYGFWTTAGTYSWTCPAGVTKVRAQGKGAGGGGGGANSPSASYPAAGAGGNGGAEFDDVFAVTPGTVYTIIIGTHGTGGAGSGGGTNGGTTSFSSAASAQGGAGGGGGAGTAGSTGAGTSATGAIIATGGSTGGYGLVTPNFAQGGSGGAGRIGASFPPATTSTGALNGNTNVLGGGGSGASGMGGSSYGGNGGDGYLILS